MAVIQKGPMSVITKGSHVIPNVSYICYAKKNICVIPQGYPSDMIRVLRLYVRPGQNPLGYPSDMIKSPNVICQTCSESPRLSVRPGQSPKVICQIWWDSPRLSIKPGQNPLGQTPLGYLSDLVRLLYVICQTWSQSPSVLMPTTWDSLVHYIWSQNVGSKIIGEDKVNN